MQSPLEIAATELEKAAKKREDIRSKEEWQIEENNTDAEDSASDSAIQPEDDDHLVEDDMSPVGINQNDTITGQEEKKPINKLQQQEESIFDPEGEDDLVEDFVLSDDETETRKKKKAKGRKPAAEKRKLDSNLARASKSVRGQKVSGKKFKRMSRAKK